jgi:endonuclease YncB( thermonuclease family)
LRYAGAEMVRALALLLVVTATAALAAPCPRGAFTGKVTMVRDGDTIVVGTMPIRLNGLAAPEWDKPGGEAATRANGRAGRGPHAPL